MGCGQSKEKQQNDDIDEEPKNNNSGNKSCENGPQVVEVQVDSTSPPEAVSSPTSCSKMGSKDNTITILHFNDVYNIEPRQVEPVGGAARFTTAVKERQHLNPMVLFSGDAFFPSLMSTVTHGKQMVPVLNALNIQCSVYGNHDFDYSVDHLVKLKNQTNFPWLMSNVMDNFTEEPLAEGLISHMVEWQGRKIGIVGLVEEEWIATLSTIDPDDVSFLDYVDEGRLLAQELRQKGADYIIALTHMRWPNDIRLAEEVKEIDIVLGGHDHDYNVRQINGKYVLKSGTDFRQFSQVTLTFGSDGKVNVSVEEVTIDSSFREDPEIKAVVEKYTELMGEKMNNVIGRIDVELDGRFGNIRTMETNMGNFVTDIMLKATDADVALLNSGTLRSDTLHPSGDFKMKDLFSILPMVDPLVVISISGEQLVTALENGVSQYPKLEGRFPQVAGVSFAFDPNNEPGKRVEPRFTKVQGQYLETDRHYKLVTKSYLADGKDGYDVFKHCKVLVDDEEGPQLSNAVQNHFKAVKILSGQKKAKHDSHHHQSLVNVSQRKSLVRQMSICEDSPPVLNIANVEDDSKSRSSASPSEDKIILKQVSAVLESSPSPRPSPSRTLGALGKASSSVSPVPSATNTPRRASLAGMSRSRSLLLRRKSIDNLEIDCMCEALAPKVEGRIVPITPEKYAELEAARLSSEVQKTTIQESSEPNTPVTSGPTSTAAVF